MWELGLGAYWIRSSSCWALVRGLMPLRRTLSCMCSPFARIWSLTHSTSSRVVLNGPFPETETETEVPLKTAFPTETEGEGQEQEERVEKRKKRKTVATKAERTRTGTVTTMPFDVPGDAKSAICGLWLCAYALWLYSSWINSAGYHQRQRFPSWRYGWMAPFYLRKCNGILSMAIHLVINLCRSINIRMFSLQASCIVDRERGSALAQGTFCLFQAVHQNLTKIWFFKGKKRGVLQKPICQIPKHLYYLPNRLISLVYSIFNRSCLIHFEWIL